MMMLHGSECYDDAHCDCGEEFNPNDYILDVIAQWFPGPTETNPQYRIVYIGSDWTSRTFRVETINREFIKSIRVSVDVEDLEDNDKNK